MFAAALILAFIVASIAILAAMPVDHDDDNDYTI